MSWLSVAALLLLVGSFMWLYLAGRLVGNRVSKMFSFAHWGSWFWLLPRGLSSAQLTSLTL